MHIAADWYRGNVLAKIKEGYKNGWVIKVVHDVTSIKWIREK